MTRRLTATVAAAAITAMVLSGCVPGREQITPTATPTVGAELTLEEIYAQEASWSGCATYECATIQVPLNWAVPEGQTIELALARHAAGDPANRLGSVLINPGGPGASGIDFLEFFVDTAGQELLDHYDIVAFDPRGVGASTPVWCGTDADVDAFYMEDVLLETQEDVEAARQRTADFAQLCRETSGPVVEYVDTVSAARDMDVIRAAVGDEALNMLGYSYGTELALAYAELYPDLVGRIVLDGAVDPLLSGEELSRGQATGFEDALTAFLEWCVGRDSCPVGPTVEDARTTVQSILTTARTSGYSASSGSVNGNIMVYGIVVTLYSEDSWEFLEMALDELLNDGVANLFAMLADFYFDRDTFTGEYNSNATVAFTAIGCLDRYEDEELWTIDDVTEYAEDVTAQSPTFGWWFASGLGCDGWPWFAQEVVEGLDNAATAAPMLIVGTSNDPATPLVWAESLAERLEMPLLVWEGEGHTAYGRSNQCVIDTVDAYFVDGAIPNDGERC